MPKPAMRAPRSMNRSVKVASFTVATGAYLPMWRQLLVDADRHLFPGAYLEVHVFSNDPEQASRAQVDVSDRTHIRVHQIPPLGWPDATLQRYELISEALTTTEAEVCLHLDADLRIVSEVGPDLHPQGWKMGIALVAHPGYWRQGKAADLSDLMGRVSVRARHRGRMGTWETRSASLAYVPWRQRQTYVCGGVWMGLTESFQSMVGLLAERTRRDRQRRILPVWHDESYLNWFASSHHTTVLDPSYCMVPDYSWLRQLDTRIIAVDKGEWIRPATPAS